jgi:hypothetical protein
MHLATEILFEPFQSLIINCSHRLTLAILRSITRFLRLLFWLTFGSLSIQRLVKLNVFPQILQRLLQFLDFSMQNIVLPLILIRLILHTFIHLIHAILQLAQIWIHIHLVLNNQVFQFLLGILQSLFQAFHFIPHFLHLIVEIVFKSVELSACHQVLNHRLHFWYLVVELVFVVDVLVVALDQLARLGWFLEVLLIRLWLADSFNIEHLHFEIFDCIFKILSLSFSGLNLPTQVILKLRQKIRILEGLFSTVRKKISQLFKRHFDRVKFQIKEINLFLNCLI